MKTTLGVTCLLAIATVATAAPTFEESMSKAAADYRQRANHAAEILNQTRARITKDKAPLLQQLRAAEDRMVAAESENTRLETQREDFTEARRAALQDLARTRQTTAYARTLAHESLKAVSDGLAPGEDQVFGKQLRALEQQLADTTGSEDGASAIAVADFLLGRTRQALGGYRTNGAALMAETGQVAQGTLAFVGPDTYFAPATDGPAGLLRSREGGKYPTRYALPSWRAQDAGEFFAGRAGRVPADASGGKALRLEQTRGTVWQHVRKGGVVALAILVVGVVATLMTLQKVRDLARMKVNSPAEIEPLLNAIATNDAPAAQLAVAGLNRTSRELFEEGLRQLRQPKTILEERLQAVLLEQRLQYERWLPLLAVIATAAPLMGLLGTVVGMVKTFALITVFGTGNAGKLSSGISEVLVATELGLMVAIPTLIAHGFLAQRIQRNLSLLERYALKFMTAVETAKSDQAKTPDVSVPA